MTVGGHLVIFEVDGVIVRPMRGHELGFLPGEYIEEVVVFCGNNFSNSFPSSVGSGSAWREVVGAGSFPTAQSLVVSLGGLIGM